MGALLVDGILLILPFIGAVIVFHQYTKAYYIAANGTIGAQYTAHNTWIESLLWLGYVLIVLCRVGSHNGQTFGKQAAKIRVVRNDGRAVDVKTVLMREGVGKMLPGVLGALSHAMLVIVLIYFLLDYLWPLWERENRALHDLLARTHVVFRDEPVRYFEPPWPAEAVGPGPATSGHPEGRPAGSRRGRALHAPPERLRDPSQRRTTGPTAPRRPESRPGGRSQATRLQTRPPVASRS